MQKLDNVAVIDSDGEQKLGDTNLLPPKPAFNDYASVHAVRGLFSQIELFPGGYGPVIASILESHAARSQSAEADLKELQAKFLALTSSEASLRTELAGKNVMAAELIELRSKYLATSNNESSLKSELAGMKNSLTMSRVLVGGGSAMAGGSFSLFPEHIGWGIAMLLVSLLFVIAGANPKLLKIGERK